MSENSQNNKYDSTLSTIMKMPGIKVNRTDVLISAYSKYVKPDDIPVLLKSGPVAVGVPKEKVDKIAKNLIDKRVLMSSSASFLTGLPGGFAMAATIPADVLQFFTVAIRMAQELAYVYGNEDIWEDTDYDSVRDQLTLYLGSMFGVTGANEAIRVVSSQLSRQVLKQLPKQALTKTTIYPIIKQIAKFLGVKMTKDIFAKGVSKAIPIIGGVVSGTITFASMKPMGNKLKTALSEATFDYTEEDLKNDMETLNKTSNNINDVEFYDAKDDTSETIDNTSNSINDLNKTSNYNTSDLISMLNEIKSMLDSGAITEHEYNSLKEKLFKIDLS